MALAALESSLVAMSCTDLGPHSIKGGYREILRTESVPRLQPLAQDLLYEYQLIYESGFDQEAERHLTDTLHIRPLSLRDVPVAVVCSYGALFED
jgi:hypothetical protein